MHGWLLAAAAALTAALPGHHARVPAVVLAEQGLARAEARRVLSADEAARYGEILRRAASVAGRLPEERRANLLGALRDVSRLWRGYTRPRALALFSALEENLHYLGSHRVPPAGTDVDGPDGVVYRLFAGHGFAFHPLANFALLNAKLAAKDEAGARQLADALLARAVPAGRSLRWEYYFPFALGRPPWVSGMAQAVAAQALARASAALADRELLAAAGGAFRSLAPRLVRRLPAGPWVKLYGFDDDVVLNAQLQAALSVGDYAELSGDPAALHLAAALERTAAALLPRFDTGFWSLYSLQGGESPLGYHDYVIQLLRKLAARSFEPTWEATAARFATYELEPPLLHPGRAPSVLYPQPADGFRDTAGFGFWLSKVSTVTLRAGTDRLTRTFDRGYHELVWAPGESPPGLYRPRLSAQDLAGNVASVALPAVLVKYDLGPPALQVSLAAPSVLTWRALDEGTPWLELAVRLDRGRRHRTIRLGTRALAGATRLRLPRGRWHATLLAANSAGAVRTVSLGFLPRP